MTTPARIQRRRTPGYRLPVGAVYVGRPTRYGNPFHTHGDGYPMDREMAVRLYREHWAEHGAIVVPWRPAVLTTLADLRRDLAGRDLACWCGTPAAGEPDHCHGSVLLTLANPPGETP